MKFITFTWRFSINRHNFLIYHKIIYLNNHSYFCLLWILCYISKNISCDIDIYTFIVRGIKWDFVWVWIITYPWNNTITCQEIFIGYVIEMGKKPSLWWIWLQNNIIVHVCIPEINGTCCIATGWTDCCDDKRHKDKSVLLIGPPHRYSISNIYYVYHMCYGEFVSF